MRDLDARGGPVRLKKPRDPGQRFDMLVFVDTQILWADPPARLHTGRLRHHEARSTHGTAAQMNQMPVSGEAILTAVLAHRGDSDTIAERHVADGERGKQVNGFHRNG